MSVTIETDLAEVLARIDRKLDRIQEDVTDLKIGQTKLEGKIEALDERLTGKIEALDERLTGKIEALDERLTGKIEALDGKLSGQISTVDEKLSGQIKTLDEKFGGQIKTLDANVSGLSTRVQNQDLLSRTVLGGIILLIIGGAIRMFAPFLPLAK